MSLSHFQAEKRKQLEKELMEMQKVDFDYHFFPADSISPGVDAHGRELNIHRRLLRLGLTHDLFESQEDYYNWFIKTQKNYNAYSAQAIATPTPLRQTANPQKRKNTGLSIFQAMQDGAPVTIESAPNSVPKC